MKKHLMVLALLSLIIVGCHPTYPLASYQFTAKVACTDSLSKMVNIQASDAGFPFSSASFKTATGWTLMECTYLTSQDWSCQADQLSAIDTGGEILHYIFQISANDPESANGVFTTEAWTAEDYCMEFQSDVQIDVHCLVDDVITADIATSFSNTGIPFIFRSQFADNWECSMINAHHLQCHSPGMVDFPSGLEVFQIHFRTQEKVNPSKKYLALLPDCYTFNASEYLECNGMGKYKLNITFSPETHNLVAVLAPQMLDCNSSAGSATCSIDKIFPQLSPDYIKVITVFKPEPNYNFSDIQYVHIPNCLIPAIEEAVHFEMGDVGCHSGSQVFVMVKLPKNLKDPQILSSLVVKDCNTTYQCYPLESDPNTLYCIGNKPQLSPVSCQVQACVQQNGHEVCQNLPAATPLDCPSEMKPPAVATNCSSFGSQPECKAASCVWHFVTAGSPFCSNK